MKQDNSNPTRDLIVKRIIDAPVERVWQAWTDPEQVKHWWGPEDFSSSLCKIDLRVGGAYVFAMQAPAEQGGGVSYTTGTYTEIVPLEKLEFTQGLGDEKGNRIDPESIGMSDFPKEIRTVVTFEAIKHDMTRLTITEYDWTISGSGRMFVYALAGLHQTADKLTKYAEGKGKRNV